MAYDVTDPRSSLATATPAAAAPTAGANAVPRAATYRELHAVAPDERHINGSHTWWTRSQAVVVASTDAQPGDVLERRDRVDEHVLLVLHPGTIVDVEAGGTTVTVDEPALVVVPPGNSEVLVRAGGALVELFAAATSPDLCERCTNTADYTEPDTNVAPWTPWPDPPDGMRTRVYPMAAVPTESNRFGRIFRCSTIMVNLLTAGEPPRDPRKLSPHHHDDFEQISLQVDGDYVHHMRTPWTPDSLHWRDDEHQHCLSPAVVVIPPLLVHTSQGVGDHEHWLIDVFAPPRVDFSRRPGWVLNASEYPEPA